MFCVIFIGRRGGRGNGCLELSLFVTMTMRMNISIVCGCIIPIASIVVAAFVIELH